ncbi:MAG: dihydrolipoyl dehydrogenase [Myxococcota bacterium]
MSEKSYDLIVIGGGPAGYVASIRAAQLGMQVACVDKRATLGGTCLNVGCIPSKALLHSSERFAFAKEEAAAHGIALQGVELDLAAMMGRKQKVVDDLTKGIDYLLDKNKVDRFHGSASIPAAGKVQVSLADGGSVELPTRNILIATGSEPTSLPGIQIDERQVVSSTGALALETVPEHLVVIGAGVIGLELGSVWSRLGARVTVVEFLDHILPGMDRDVSKQAQKILGKQGLDFRLSSKVTALVTATSGVAVQVEPSQGGEPEQLDADVVLVAVGRRPYTEGLGLEAVGVTQDERGFLAVDGAFQTSVPGIYAVGDCVPGPMLAHKAEEDAIACVETLAGQAGHVDYDRVPGVVYTHPEIAGVGKTEDALKAEGTPYRAAKFPFSANSRAKATGETDGFVKVLVSEEHARVLGMHIIGPGAGDLLQEAVLGLEYGATAEDLARTCHAHPGMGEAVKEAALAALGRALHI